MMEKYKFEQIEKKFAFLRDSSVKEYLKKWDVDFGLQSFNYDKPADEMDMQKLLKHFFEDKDVLDSIKVDNYVNKLEVEQLGTTVLNMDFFDKLGSESNEVVIVRQNGTISGCPPDLMEGIQIEDELRRCLLNEESENYNIFSEEQRAEFIFKLFTAIVVGGPMCQYEDQFSPYLDVVKSIYKDLVAVKQTTQGEKLIRSFVYSVKILKRKDSSEDEYFPGGRIRPHPQTFCYVIVDPFCRHVTLLTHKWIQNKIF